MESDDLPLIDIGHEDDALLNNLQQDDALLNTFQQDDAVDFIACSPLVVARSVGPSRPPKTAMDKGKVQFGETRCLMLDENKENLQVSNSILGSGNLNLEPQKMKRSRKAGACNLRKSLAWDKAFFTEEGVLSSVELSIICGTPSKLVGEELSTICEEKSPPTFTKAVPQTLDSKLFMKLPPNSLNSNKKTGENSVMKQKSAASSSLKPKRLLATTSAKKSERKEVACSKSIPSTSNHKRLLSTSPAKPAIPKSKISKIQGSKPDPCMTTTKAHNLDASNSKRTRIAPPASCVQKHLGPKISSNTRSTSTAPKIVAQRVPRPTKSSDQRIRKNKTDFNAREKPSASYQTPKVKEVNSSDVNPDKKILVGSKAEIRTSKPSVSVHANSDSTNNVDEHSAQLQATRPSGLRMPSPSLRFFSEPKQPVSSTAGQRNTQPSNLLDPVIPFSHIEGASGHSIEPKIPKAKPSRGLNMDSVQQCSVLSVKSPEVSCQSEEHKNNKLSVLVQALLHVKQIDRENDGILVDVDKHFLEHGQTSLSAAGAGRKDDDRSVFSDRVYERNDRDMLQASKSHLKTHVELQVEDAPMSDENLDCYFKHRKYNLSIHNKVCRLGSEVDDSDKICSLVSGQEVEDSIIGHREAQELQVPFHVIDEVPQVNDGLSLNSERVKGGLSPERDSESDVINNVMDADESATPPAEEEAFSASFMEVVDTVTKQKEVLHCAIPSMDQLAFVADDSTLLDNDDFIMAPNGDERNELLAIEATIKSGFPDAKLQAEDHTDVSIGEYTNIAQVGRNSQVEPQLSPKACKGRIDEMNTDNKLSFSIAEGPELDTARSSTHVSNQQCKISDELMTEALMPYKAISGSGSLNSEPCLEDLVYFDGRELNNQAQFYLNSSTVSVEPLMLNEVELGSFRNDHGLGDLASDHDEGLISLAEFQLNPNTSRVQIEGPVVSTVEGLDLESEITPVFLEKDIYCADIVTNDGRELAQCNHTEIILTPNNHGNQTADAPTININEASPSSHGNQTASWPPSDPDRYRSSPPHGCYLLLEASRDASTGVGKQETDDQIRQETSNHSLDIKQKQENLSLLIESPRNCKRSHDQTTVRELPLSPKNSEDCSRSPAANCGLKASSPPKENSLPIRNASNNGSSEQYESENLHEVHCNMDNEDAETNTVSCFRKILKEGENQSPLVIRPPKGVVPFSDEWLAALEAAGEDILTLKTGRVQNSPPSRSSPEPGPWSPVKKKATQAIGPYDCTKYTSGQH